MEVFRASPRQADLMIVAGRVSQKMAPGAAPDLRPDAQPQVGARRWASARRSGGMFNNYAIVQGVDHVVPVDIYLPGCPPRPEMLMDAILKLHEQISAAPSSASTASRRAREARGRCARRRAHRADEGPAQVSEQPGGLERSGADEDAIRAPQDAPEAVEVRRGMFGADRLRRHLGLRRPGPRRRSCPASTPRPYGGWFDEVADALERGARRAYDATPSRRSSSTAAS